MPAGKVTRKMRKLIFLILFAIYFTLGWLFPQYTRRYRFITRLSLLSDSQFCCFLSKKTKKKNLYNNYLLNRFDIGMYVIVLITRHLVSKKMSE